MLLHTLWMHGSSEQFFCNVSTSYNPAYLWAVRNCRNWWQQWWRPHWDEYDQWESDLQSNSWLNDKIINNGINLSYPPLWKSCEAHTRQFEYQKGFRKHFSPLWNSHEALVRMFLCQEGTWNQVLLLWRSCESSVFSFFLRHNLAQ